MKLYLQTEFESVDLRDVHNTSCFTERNDHNAVLKQYYEIITTKSKKLKEECFKYENIQYGESLEESMDVFYPEHILPKTGIVVFIHGGYWSEGCTSDYFFVAKPFIEAGKICILFRRKLLPTVRLDEIINQDRQAMRCIVEHFPESNDLTLFGHSSGGHECVMMLSIEWKNNPKIDDYFRQKLIRVVPVCGIFEVTHLLDTTFDDEVGLMWEEANKNSPVACIRQLSENMKKYDCKLVLVGAGKDSPTILQWGNVYKKELTAEGVPFSSAIHEELDHFNIIETFDDVDATIAKIVLGDDDTN